MATYGITSAGCVIPQLVDIQSEINTGLQTLFGADVNLAATSIFGQLSGFFAEREALIWLAYQDAYNSQYRSTAFGVSLDNVGELTNIKRFGALPTSVPAVKLFGTPGTLVPATTTQFSIQNQPTSLFRTVFDVTLVAGQNCVQTLAFSSVPDAGIWALSLYSGTTPDLAYNATASVVQAAIRTLPFAAGCTVIGDYAGGFTITFSGAGTGGLMGQPVFGIAKNELTTTGTTLNIIPQITQGGVDQGTVDVVAVNTGALVCNVGSLTTIATPISGLNQILNPNAGIPGRAVETDNAYRLRQAQELQITGGSTYNALVSKLLNLNGVTAVVLFENYTDTTDGRGVPPHAFEAFVQGGDPQTIGNTIFGTKPIGIQSYGTNLVTVTDSQGNPHPVYYSVPTLVPVYIKVMITVDSSYPPNGDAVVISELVQYGETLSIGETLIVSPKLISVLANIQGIQDLTIYVGKAPNPSSSANLTFAANEVAEFDPSFITVVHV